MKNDEIVPQAGNADKVEHYGWIVVDEPGEMKKKKKSLLEIDHTYQRTHSNDQATEMASHWSWVGCGTIIVVRRGSGLFVVDGQHRVLAANKRSDIDLLPCIIFNSESISEEARNFVRTNTNRRNVKSLDKFKANLVAKDEITLYIDKILNQNGIRVSHSTNSPGAIKSVVFCQRMVHTDKDSFENVMEFLGELCVDDPIHEKLLGGIWYLTRNLTVDINDKRLRNRILQIGVPQLIREANAASAYHGKGGPRIWAMGMLKRINTGLRNKFEFKEGMEIPE